MVSNPVDDCVAGAVRRRASGGGIRTAGIYAAPLGDYLLGGGTGRVECVILRTIRSKKGFSFPRAEILEFATRLTKKRVSRAGERQYSKRRTPCI